MLLNVHLLIGHSTLKQIVRSVLRLLGCVFRMTRELVTSRSTAALLMLLAALRIRWSSSSLVFNLCAYIIAFT